MNSAAARLVRFAAALLVLVSVGSILTGHAAKPDEQGLPTDWSHRHLIFSEPATATQAARVERDPRYLQQWIRRKVARVISEDGSAPAASTGLNPPPSVRYLKLHRDWSANLGSGATVGAGNFPAKYSFQITNANCGSATQPDYVVFTTSLLGSASQASVAAYDNLYSGCTGTVPTVYWAYNTGGQVLTSPVISGDGKQVAFVQTNAGLIGTLVLLKWAAASGTVGAPVTLTAVSNAAYRSCTAPCMTTIILRDGLGIATDDITSSVFPDYTHDIIWVGGASSWLHKITGVFRGTPAEATTGGFPHQLNSGNPNALSSPVYDFATGNVFVGDLGGFIYRVVGTTGAVTASGQVDHGTGIVAGPIVDSTAGKVYVFASSDGTTNCTGPSACAAVHLFAANFASGSTGSKAVVGVSSATPNPLYDGDFDSTYLNSVNTTGNLYVCGNTGGPPILYQVPINAGVMGTSVAGPTLSSATTACSPVTDISNPNASGGTAEWIFAGVQTGGLNTSCASGGCIANFKVQPWQALHSYTVGKEVVDTHFEVQMVTTAGTSGGSTPTWSTTAGGTTTDGTVKWLNLGGTTAATPGTWAKLTNYPVGSTILDSNNKLEIVTTSNGNGESGGIQPTWSTTIGGTTPDAAVTWTNVGTIPSSALHSAGGTSGIIIDNTVGSGTLAGASQAYFSTLSNQTCGTSGTGGCAVQASQSALQ
jgi:hypothetical protein